MEHDINASSDAAGTSPEAPAGGPPAVNVDALMEALAWPFDSDADVVTFDIDDETILVLGSLERASQLGAVIGEAGPKLVTAVAQGLKASQALGAASGSLVRIDKSTRAAMRAGRTTVEAGGWVQGVIRGGDGKFIKVARMKPVGGAVAMGMGVQVLGAILMQAQLDQIQKQLSRVTNTLGEMRATHANERLAERRSLDAVLGEVYRTSHATGQLSAAQWAQVAPALPRVYALREETVLALEAEIKRAAGAPPLFLHPMEVAARTKRAAEQAATLKSLAARLDADDRRIAQAHSLRVWHLLTTGDPALGPTVNDTRDQSERRLADRDRLLGAIEAIAASPNVGRGLPTFDGQRAKARQRAFVESREVHALRAVLPSRMIEAPRPAAANASPWSELALSPDEVVAVIVAQCGLVARCGGGTTASGPVRAFLHAAVKRILAMDPAALGEPARNLWDTLSSAADAADEQRTVLADFDTLAPLVAGRGDRLRSLLLLHELAVFQPLQPAAEPSSDVAGNVLRAISRPGAAIAAMVTSAATDEQVRIDGIAEVASLLRGVSRSDAKLVTDRVSRLVGPLFPGSDDLARLAVAAFGPKMGARVGPAPDVEFLSTFEQNLPGTDPAPQAQQLSRATLAAVVVHLNAVALCTERAPDPDLIDAVIERVDQVAARLGAVITLDHEQVKIAREALQVALRETRADFLNRRVNLFAARRRALV